MADRRLPIENRQYLLSLSFVFLFYSFNTLKNLPRSQCPGEAGKNLELALPEHFHSHRHILEEVERPHLEAHDHADLVHASALLDISQGRFVKRCHIRNCRFDPFAQGRDLHGIHHLRDVHLLRAPRRAGLARSAQPHRFAVENQIVHTEADRVDQLGRFVIHRVGDRTAG